MKNFGLQAYTIRDCMQTMEDIRNAFLKVAALGYTEIQLAGLAAGTPQDYRDAADMAGLSVIGTHIGFSEMLENPARTMENHQILGTSNIGIGGMPIEARENADALKKFIENANRLSEIFGRNGFKFTYHNHSFEFAHIEGGIRPMDVLVEELDAKNASFVLDTYWLQNAGADPVAWVKKLAGRIDILHLKDMGVEGNSSVICEIGNGNIDFVPIISAAKEAGVSHYVVEQDNHFTADDPLKAIAVSAEAMKAF